MKCAVKAMIVILASFDVVVGAEGSAPPALPFKIGKLGNSGVLYIPPNSSRLKINFFLKKEKAEVCLELSRDSLGVNQSAILMKANNCVDIPEYRATTKGSELELKTINEPSVLRLRAWTKPDGYNRRREWQIGDLTLLAVDEKQRMAIFAADDGTASSAQYSAGLVVISW